VSLAVDGIYKNKTKIKGKREAFSTTLKEKYQFKKIFFFFVFSNELYGDSGPLPVLYPINDQLKSHSHIIHEMCCNISYRLQQTVAADSFRGF